MSADILRRQSWLPLLMCLAASSAGAADLARHIGDPLLARPPDLIGGKLLPGDDEVLPQSAVVNGSNVLVYGMPKSSERDTAGMSPDPHGAIAPEQAANFLKVFRLPSSMQSGFDMNAVTQSIKEGRGVTVNVNTSRLWEANTFDGIDGNHGVMITGVACSAATGEVVGFYLVDPERVQASDMSRFLTVPEMHYLTDAAGVTTVTTDEPFKLRNQDLAATGNELGNILVGNQGDNILTGGRGNDLLIGGAGNDTYVFAKGDGQDVVYDHDATKGNIDTLRFSSARQTDLSFSQVGRDLQVKVLGSTDQVTVKDWYVGGSSGADNHIERIKTADGKTLYDTDVEKLVQSMASFAPPAATQTTWATYVFAKGDGQDMVYDHDATKANLDTLKFSDARQTNLWFNHVGKDLQINVLGTTDQVTVKDWYVAGTSGTDNHIERIRTADGKTLYDTDVEKLVQAMASFAPPSATQTSWKEGQTSQGQVLLSITH